VGISESLIPGGEFEMGDHFNFVDPSHPSDETPIHKVKVSPFYCAKTETTNQQFLAFLNDWMVKNLIEVKSNTVYLTGTSDIVCYTYQFATYYNISFDGKQFSLADFRGNHPMVGVIWGGAATFCNWLSYQNNLDACYDLKTWNCDYAQNGYRLPSEAEWEFAARGGKLNPYLNYPNGNILDPKAANLPNSGDPYESAGTNGYPLTTPVAFYDGQLHVKTDFNWPGNVASYQTNDGANGYGLYDMQGNVWEFLNDWYGQNYYSLSPYENPRGPSSGFIMPDGKPYRGMRGGNWYNGLMVGGISDGHSRVSNRNPSYYRGPQDPNHPYYHLGFRVVRNYDATTGLNDIHDSQKPILFQNYPNPFNSTTSIEFSIPEYSRVSIKIFDDLGNQIETLMDQSMIGGRHTVNFNGSRFTVGCYYCKLTSGNYTAVKQMILIK
jgi:formylglycine-generating enzyme required for sulfatase activity